MLNKFAQQLATWSTEIIEKGRTPFRRVETYPEVTTSIGPVRIPLVLWINRQSMMTGGIILLPRENLEETLEQGRHCALALGLKYFVTWEKNRVRTWKICPQDLFEYQVLTLNNPEHPETFRFILEDLFESLKLTIVMDPIAPADLCASYFVNLYRATLQKALPSTIETYRSQREDDDSTQADNIDLCAQEANRLTLLQIISLLRFDLMPTSILPEKLEQALTLSLSQLPKILQHNLTLNKLTAPPDLALEAAVAYHHLILRLRQLSWAKNPERVSASLMGLSRNWFPQQPSPGSDCSIDLHPLTPSLEEEREFILSDSPSLLALSALLQCSSGRTRTEFVFGHALILNQHMLPHGTVSARLVNNRPISAQERSEFSTQLRQSWPHRRFKIRTGQPLWLWEFIHLLGVSHPGQQLRIEIPQAALHTALTGPVWTLLSEFFRLETITPKETVLLVSLSRQDQADSPVAVCHPEGIREVDPTTEQLRFRNQLLLALALPEDIYRVIEDQLVWPPPRSWDDFAQKELAAYAKTRFFQFMQRIVAPGELSVSEAHEKADSDAFLIPVPEARILKQLARVEKSIEKRPETPSVDQLLAEMLHCPHLTTLELDEVTTTGPKTPKKSTIDKRFRDYLVQQARAYGVPNFPDQYLYFLDQPEMCDYHLDPPLTLKSRFLGQFSLENDDGRVIEGYGEELEQALIFCAQAGKHKVTLPTDREQINLLLQYYHKDLNLLYEHMKNLCFGEIANPKEAHKTLNMAWKKLLLPEIEWFKN
ncbi:MAG: hypothetical protein JXQ81_11475 [Desulfuromonadales bacterium]|nr:hypothetical protein [Desulfuromonadales bacterium]MBN2793119.1 hypothetical protein [Desulfuromonadales bacterium]